MPSVVLHEFAGLAAPQRAFADRAALLLQSVVNDPRFPTLIGQATYSNTYRAVSQSKMVRTTTAQIAEIIARGLEFPPTPSDDPSIDLRVALDDGLGPKELGRVVKFETLIHANPDFVQTWFEAGDVLNLAALLMHEWMHVAGFFHLPGAGTSDVAYTLGKIAVALGRELGPSFVVEAHAPFDLGFGFLEALERWECPGVDEGEFVLSDEPEPLPTRDAEAEPSPRGAGPAPGEEGPVR